MSCPIHPPSGARSPYEHKGLAAVTDFGGDERDQYWKSVEARRAAYYGPMARKAKQARDQIAQVAIEQVRQEIVPRMAMEAVRTSLAREERKGPIRDLLAEIFRTVGRRFAREAFNEVKTTEQKADPVDEWFRSVEQWLSAEGGAEIRAILETTRQDITQILSTARADGLGSEEMAKRLEDQIDEVNRQRGRVIARTEVITASNKASHEGAKATGLALEKEWTDSADSRVRDSHEIIDGQVQPIDEPFRWDSPMSGSVEAMYPAQADLPAAERIQCRCVSLRRPMD